MLLINKTSENVFLRMKSLEEQDNYSSRVSTKMHNSLPEHQSHIRGEFWESIPAILTEMAAF